MLFEQFSERGAATLRRAAELARRSGAVTPGHLLAAALEVSELLGKVAGPTHVPLVLGADGKDEPQPRAAVHFDMLARQAIANAGAWSTRRHTRAGPEDLLVVLLDQASPSVVAALARIGPEADRLRRVALHALGLPDGYGPVALDPLPPAGTIDRPAFGLEELPADAWAELTERQARLPLRRIRRRSDWAAVSINEQRAVLKMAARRRLTDDETHSLLDHHRRAVQALAGVAAPGLVAEPAWPGGGWLRTGHLTGQRRRRPIPRGWVVWFGNRRVGLKAAWFRWTAQRY